jgi:PBSX family phage terminase large subunit
MQLEATPKSLHLMTGRTSESLYDNLVRPILDLDKYGRVKMNARGSLMRYDDKEIRLVGCDNANAENKVKGKTVGSWWADEVTGHPEGLVDMAWSRCSEGGRVVPKFWTCNPDNPNHFVKVRFIDSDKLDVKNWYFGFPDNPALSEGLISELKSAFTGAFYDRMILGKWTVAEGVVYDKFDRSLHCIDSIPQERIVDYVMGIDWGYSEALAMTLYGLDEDGRFYQIDEYKEKGKNIDQSLIEELKVKGWFNLPLWRFNGAFWDKFQTKPSYAYADSNRPEYVEMFHRLSGVTTIPARKPSKAELIQSVQRKYVADGQGKFGIYYLNGKCNKTLSEKDGYRWKDGAKGDEVVKENDHLQDCEQYAIFNHANGKVRFARGY